MAFAFKQAQPINERLLIGLSGPAGGGKTVSALRIATGIIAGTDKKIAFIDTENNRGLRYAKNFRFEHLNFEPPFSSSRYLEALLEADKIAGEGGVIIIDSMSHEHEGPGGLLDAAETYLETKAGSDYKKREALKMSAWIKPKAERTRLIQFGLQRTRAHVILCFRAKEKVAMIKDSQNKTQIVNQGFQIIGGDEFAFEMSIMAVLPPGAQGRPDWTEKAGRINDLDGDLKSMLHGTEQFSEDTGKRIRELCSINPVSKNTDLGHRGPPEKTDFMVYAPDGSILRTLPDIAQWSTWYKGNLKKMDTLEKLNKFWDANLIAYDLLRDKGFYDAVQEVENNVYDMKQDFLRDKESE